MLTSVAQLVVDLHVPQKVDACAKERVNPTNPIYLGMPEGVSTLHPGAEMIRELAPSAEERPMRSCDESFRYMIKKRISY